MFENKVKEAREAVGITQTKLACLSGLAASLISDIELGKRYPYPKARKVLAEALGVSESELFPECVGSGSPKN